MIVYVVVFGEYSDQRVVGVFDDEMKAYEAADRAGNCAVYTFILNNPDAEIEEVTVAVDINGNPIDDPDARYGKFGKRYKTVKTYPKHYDVIETVEDYQRATKRIGEAGGGTIQLEGDRMTVFYGPDEPKADNVLDGAYASSARGYEHALKIARDLLAKYKAEEAGI